MGLRIEDIDFSKCVLNPNKPTFLADIKAIPEFNGNLTYKISRKSVIAYIVMMYDHKCSLWREVRSLPARKAMAMELAGFARDKDGKFSYPSELIFQGKNQEVNSMIIKYLVLQNNPRWGQLCAYETLYYYELARIQNMAGVKTKETIDNLEKLSLAINELTEEILGGTGEATPILEAIYNELTKDLDISPEKVSEYIMADGKCPDDWCPYNEWIEQANPKEKAEIKKSGKEKYKVTDDMWSFLGDK